MKYTNMDSEIQRKVKKLYNYYIEEKEYRKRNKFKLIFVILFHIGCIIWLTLVSFIAAITNLLFIAVSFAFNLFEYEDPTNANRKLIDQISAQTNNRLTRICYLISLIICDIRYIFTRNKYDMFLIHFLEYFNSVQMSEFLPSKINPTNYTEYCNELIKYDNEQLYFAKECIRMSLFYKIRINDNGDMECC